MLPLWEPEEQRRRWGAQGGLSGLSFSPGRFMRKNHATHCSKTSCTYRAKIREELLKLRVEDTAKDFRRRQGGKKLNLRQPSGIENHPHILIFI